MSDEPPPHLRVVSERSPEQVSKELALQDLQWALRSMTANLLRVTRGAGKPWEVLSHTVDLVNAF